MKKVIVYYSEDEIYYDSIDDAVNRIAKYFNIQSDCGKDQIRYDLLSGKIYKTAFAEYRIENN